MSILRKTDSLSHPSSSISGAGPIICTVLADMDCSGTNSSLGLYLFVDAAYLRNPYQKQAQLQQFVWDK